MKTGIIKLMDFELFRQQISLEVFDYQVVKNFFKDLKKPRDKISSLLAEGKIIRVKKGLYVFSEKWRRSSLSLEMLANLIYGPSCISFEYALNQYNFIAERPIVVTSLSLGASKSFHTSIGNRK